MKSNTKRIAYLNNDRSLKHDVLSETSDGRRDSGLEPYKLMHKLLREKWRVYPDPSLNQLINSDIWLCTDMPGFKSFLMISLASLILHKRVRLIVIETDIAKPRIWLKFRFWYEKILLHSDLEVDYIYGNKCETFRHPVIPLAFKNTTFKNAHKRKYLLTMLSMHNSSINPKSSYRFRRNLALELSGKDGFRLCGSGWNYHPLPMELGYIKAIANKIGLNKLYSKIKGYKSIDSEVDLKSSEVYMNTDFAICIDPDITGNAPVRERIIECLLYGAIPIYWGSKNIHNIIPSECYIDGRLFPNGLELLNFLKNLSQSEVNKYRNSIETFKQSTNIKEFENYYFAEKVQKWMEK